MKTKSAGISIPPCGRSNENLRSPVTLIDNVPSYLRKNNIGITTTDPSKVRSGEFYSKCMEKAITILDSDDTEDDPFTL